MRSLTFLAVSRLAAADMVAASSVPGSRPQLSVRVILYIHRVAHAQSDLLGGGHGGGQLRAGQPAPALSQANLLYIHKVAHAQSDLLGGVTPGGGGHGGGELGAGQPAPALCQGVQVSRHIRQLHQLQHTQRSSLGRYVFGSEISYNKAPPRLPGLGC
jgi:hypothetical protein